MPLSTLPGIGSVGVVRWVIVGVGWLEGFVSAVVLGEGWFGGWCGGGVLGCGVVEVGGGWFGCWGGVGVGVWMQTVKAKVVDGLGRTLFGKVKITLVLVLSYIKTLIRRC